MFFCFLHFCSVVVENLKNSILREAEECDVDIKNEINSGALQNILISVQEALFHRFIQYRSPDIMKTVVEVCDEGDEEGIKRELAKITKKGEEVKKILHLLNHLCSEVARNDGNVSSETWLDNSAATKVGVLQELRSRLSQAARFSVDADVNKLKEQSARTRDEEAYNPEMDPLPNYQVTLLAGRSLDEGDVKFQWYLLENSYRLGSVDYLSSYAKVLDSKGRGSLVRQTFTGAQKAPSLAENSLLEPADVYPDNPELLGTYERSAILADSLRRYVDYLVDTRDLDDVELLRQADAQSRVRLFVVPDLPDVVECFPCSDELPRNFLVLTSKEVVELELEDKAKPLPTEFVEFLETYEYTTLPEEELFYVNVTDKHGGRERTRRGEPPNAGLAMDLPGVTGAGARASTTAWAEAVRESLYIAS